MNLKEARNILNISDDATPEEAKKQYRKLTKEFHPDVNKAPDAEEKFKTINEAYQCIQNGKGNDPESISYNKYNPFHQQIIELENISIHLTISFKEAVMGCKKEVKYSRSSKCIKCSGQGQTTVNNGCKKCNGAGRFVNKQSSSIFITTCTECLGKNKNIECDICNGGGFVQTDVSVHVAVPAGIINGNILRLQGMGNYAGSFMNMIDQYTDAFCHISVLPEDGLSIDGKSVISNLTISLLEALQGCNKNIKSINGDIEVQIKPKSRNRDEIIIPHLGVGGIGDQRVILDVQYPNDVSNIIDTLIK